MGLLVVHLEADFFVQVYVDSLLERSDDFNGACYRFPGYLSSSES